MANLGRMLVRGLGAALQGYGEGMTLVEARNQREREAAALDARQRAREELAFERSQQGADADVKRRLNVTEGETAIRVGAVGAELQAREPYEARSQGRQAEAAAALADRQHGYRMTEAEHAARLELQQRMELERITVDEYRPTADGRIIALANGRIVGASRPGLVAPDVPRNSGGAASTSLDTYRRGAGAPAPAAGAAPPVRRLVYNPETGRLE